MSDDLTEVCSQCGFTKGNHRAIDMHCLKTPQIDATFLDSVFRSASGKPYGVPEVRAWNDAILKAIDEATGFIGQEAAGSDQHLINSRMRMLVNRLRARMKPESGKVIEGAE